MNDPITLDMILRFFGRLHPMMVHFPIALLVTAALIELWNPKRSPEAKGPGAALVCLTIGTLSAIVAATCGWFNAEYETHGRSLAQTLFWHRWLGVSLAGVSFITWIFALIQAKKPGVGTRRIYRFGLLVTVGLVAVTGHLGGVMTHGDEYLTEPFTADPGRGARSEKARPTDLTAAPDAGDAPAESPPLTPNEQLFVDRIAPLFAASCIECHGPSKKKGGLRLDRKDDVFDPKQEGLIVAGKPDESLLYELVHHPEFEDERMPKKADPLTDEQNQAIHDWIEGGAAWPDSYGEIEYDPDAAPKSAAKPTKEERALAAAQAKSEADAAAAEQQAAERAEAIARMQAAVTELTERGIHAQRIAANTDDVEANFTVLGSRVTDEDVAALAGLESNLTWLNLSRTSVTDVGVATLAPFTRLERLNLAKTKITDEALATIGEFGDLVYLNLYGTEVTDQGLEHLHDLSQLERLYLWDTRVTDEGVASLLEANRTLSIDRGEAAKVIAELKPEPAKPIAPKPKEAEKKPAEAKPDAAKPAEKSKTDPKKKPREEDTAA